MKSEGKIGNFIHELRENSLLRYNIVKGILLILLVIFIAGLLSANAGSDKSVEEITRMVVPDLRRRVRSRAGSRRTRAMKMPAILRRKESLTEWNRLQSWILNESSA